MDPRPGAWTDEQFDVVLAHVLRAGVAVAAFVVVVGAIVYLMAHGFDVSDHRVFHGEPDRLRSVAGIAADAKQLHGRGVIQLGLLLLIATPIARVVFSVLGFIRQHDWLYVGITSVVLLLLAYSLLAG